MAKRHQYISIGVIMVCLLAGAIGWRYSDFYRAKDFEDAKHGVIDDKTAYLQSVERDNASIVVLDEDHVVVAFSKGAREMFGEDSLHVGFGPEIIVPPEFRERHLTSFTSYVDKVKRQLEDTGEVSQKVQRINCDGNLLGQPVPLQVSTRVRMVDNELFFPANFDRVSDVKMGSMSKEDL